MQLLSFVRFEAPEVSTELARNFSDDQLGLEVWSVSVLTGLIIMYPLLEESEVPFFAEACEAVGVDCFKGANKGSFSEKLEVALTFGLAPKFDEKPDCDRLLELVL